MLTTSGASRISISSSHLDIYCVHPLFAIGVTFVTFAPKENTQPFVPGNKVVLKSSVDSAREYLGNEIIRLLNLPAPSMHIKSPESFQPLLEAIRTRFANVQDAVKLKDKFQRTPVLMMEFLAGFTFDDLKQEVRLLTEYQNLLNDPERGPALLYDMGRLAAFDTFIGNTDRLPFTTFNDGNLGNVMLSSDWKLLTLDNAAFFFRDLAQHLSFLDTALCSLVFESRDPITHAELFSPKVQKCIKFLTFNGLVECTAEVQMKVQHGIVDAFKAMARAEVLESIAELIARLDRYHTPLFDAVTYMTQFEAFVEVYRRRFFVPMEEQKQAVDIPTSYYADLIKEAKDRAVKRLADATQRLSAMDFLDRAVDEYNQPIDAPQWNVPTPEEKSIEGAVPEEPSYESKPPAFALNRAWSLPAPDPASSQTTPLPPPPPSSSSSSGVSSVPPPPPSSKQASASPLPPPPPSSDSREKALPPPPSAVGTIPPPPPSAGAAVPPPPPSAGGAIPLLPSRASSLPPPPVSAVLSAPGKGAPGSLAAALQAAKEQRAKAQEAAAALRRQKAALSNTTLLRFLADLKLKHSRDNSNAEDVVNFESNPVFKIPDDDEPNGYRLVVLSKRTRDLFLGWCARGRAVAGLRKRVHETRERYTTLLNEFRAAWKSNEVPYEQLQQALLSLWVAETEYHDAMRDMATQTHHLRQLARQQRQA